MLRAILAKFGELAADAGGTRSAATTSSMATAAVMSRERPAPERRLVKQADGNNASLSLRPPDHSTPRAERPMAGS
jgi:hypothetical protein